MGLIGGAFILFGYLFKRPDDILKKIKEAENNLKEVIERSTQILERLKFQYEHQESVFILGKKGLFSYTKDDWNFVKIYAQNAAELPEDERTANDWIFIGLIEYKEEKYLSSIRAYNKALEINESSEVTWKHLGNAYDANQDFDKSIFAYKKVIELNPKNGIAFNNLGIVYSALNNFELAEQNFIQGIRLNPDNNFIYTNYFELCLTNNKEVPTKYVDAFLDRFKTNKPAMASFEMYNIYKGIVNQNIENLNKELSNWEEEYISVGDDELFREIQKWINSEVNSKYKVDLQMALDFFSGSSKPE